MAETPITRPHLLQWPLSEQQVDDLNATIDDIYELLKQRKGAAAPDHQLLSDPHTDTTPADEVNGDLVVGQGGKFERFPVGANGDHLQVVAGAPVWDADGSTLEDLNATEITSGTLDPARLANSGVAAGTYGDATHVSQVTVDLKGRVTAAVDVVIAIPPATHNLLSSTHPDTTAASPTLGDIVVAQNAGAVDVQADWFDGQPYDYVPNANNNGEEKYWGDGLPGAGLVSTGAVTWARKANGTAGYVLMAGATGPDWQPNTSSSQAAAIYRAADLAIAFGTPTTIPLDTTVFDDGFWSSGSPTRLTVPSGQGGRYAIVAAAAIDYGFVGDWAVYIYVNGIAKAKVHDNAFTSVVGTYGNVQCCSIENLNAGDYVELAVEWNYGGGHGPSYTLKGGLVNTFLKMVKL